MVTPASTVALPSSELRRDGRARLIAGASQSVAVKVAGIPGHGTSGEQPDLH